MLWQKGTRTCPNGIWISDTTRDFWSNISHTKFLVFNSDHGSIPLIFISTFYQSQFVLNPKNLKEMLTMLTMHIFGILRLWGFQNTQFCSKLIRFCWLVTLYSFFYYTNSKFLLHKDFFPHHKHCSGGPLCIIKFIFQAKIRPKILAILAQKWVFAAKWPFGLEIKRWSL